MTPNDRLYVAAWIYHYFLHPVQFPVMLDDRAHELFPYIITGKLSPLQTQARFLRDNPPKVSYETTE